jgi:MEMO1 family protein
MPGPRPSPIAGRWYPADPQQLASMVDKFLTNARPYKAEGEVVAVVAPHAGYIYSGAVAGSAFAPLRGMKPDVVVVVSPMHQPHSQPLLTSAHSAYCTPLGLVPIDREKLAALDDCLQAGGGLRLSPLVNDMEHSLEIELPFLQRVLPEGFRLVPIMVRHQTFQVAYNLGQALAEILQDCSAILVASTDLSHFFPQEIAISLDAEVIKRLEEFDPEALLVADEEGKGFACGHGALAAVLWAAKGLGADRIKVIHYATSADVTGDFDQVVGYAGAVATRQKSLN